MNSSLNEKENSQLLQKSRSQSFYEGSNGSKFCSFVIPAMIHPNIGNIKMKDLVHSFRTELLVYDLEKKNGIVFNLPDTLQCGMFGLCAVAENLKECIKIIDNSVTLIRSQVFSKDSKQLIQDSRTDIIELNDIIGKIKMFIKGVLKN
jgi:hypothetical protein